MFVENSKPVNRTGVPTAANKNVKQLTFIHQTIANE